MMDTNEKKNPWWFEIILGIIIVGLGIWTLFDTSQHLPPIPPNGNIKAISDIYIGPVIIAIGFVFLFTGVYHFNENLRKKD